MKSKASNAPIAGLAMLAGMLIIVIAGFRLNTPPAIVPADAPPGVFSAERAAMHLPHIASQKNPIGSPANEEVRNYIIKQLEALQLEPHLHLTEFYDPVRQRAATLGNVLARIEGTGDGNAIMFMGHYDTVEDAYGASDNGAAVVTMLETIRLLQHHPQLRNDLIFFFPDGEEVGLLGAQAFLEEHPWAADVVAVINLEARGTKGQSFMFETGWNNLEIIRQMAKGLPYPTASSLSYEIYSRMPTDTDFSPFKNRGYQGLNIAYIDNSFDYHTAGDNIDNTDLRSIQHHGEYTRALSLHLGNQPPDFGSNQNAIYFNTIGYRMALYPYSWAVPLALIIFLLFAGVMFMGFRSSIIRLQGWLFGLIAVVGLLFMIFIVAGSLFEFIRGFYPGSSFALLNYQQHRLFAGFAVITIAVSFAFYGLLLKGLKLWQAIATSAFLVVLLIISNQASLLFITPAIVLPLLLHLMYRKQASLWELAAGSFTVWAVLMIVISFSVPGVSYLFAWPLLFSIIPVGFFFMQKKKTPGSGADQIFLLIFALPVLLWFPELNKMFSLAMGLPAMAVSMLIPGLMFTLLIPHIDIITRRKAWLVPVLAGSLGVFLLVIGSTGLDYDERHRKANNIIYAANGDTGQSYWVSLDGEADEWTSRFLTETPAYRQITDFYPIMQGDYPVHPAKEAGVAHPVATLLHDSIAGSERILRLHLASPRNAGRMLIFINADGGDLHIRLNEGEKHQLHSHDHSGWFFMPYFAFPEKGIELTMHIDRDISPGLLLTDITQGLPQYIDYDARPEYMMPQGDRTLASRIYIY